MLADADTLKFQAAFDICDRDQAEIGCPATDIADQHDIATSNQVSPFSARLRHPGVKCSLWLLQQCHAPNPRNLGGFSGEASCDLIERGGNGYNDLALREIAVSPLRPFGMKECVPKMLKVKA